MRVRIGKYVHWFTVTRAEDKYLEWRFNKPAWDIDNRDHTKLDKIVLKLLDGWQNVLHYTVNQIQKRRERKVRVHLDPWDAWDANTTLSYIILPLLEKLKEEKYGAPFVDTKDVPKELRDKKLTKKQKERGEVGDKHFERWDYVLDAMIYSFREVSEHNPGEEEFFTGESDTVFTAVDADGNEVDEDTYDGFMLYRMDKGPNDTRQVDWEGLDKYKERVDYGLRMFGKYYLALWN